MRAAERLDHPYAVAPRTASEAAIAAAWEWRAYAPESLVDSRGRRLRVVFPGRRWGGPGPDFKGALLALPDGTLLRGDVEIHRRASGWTQHRHARDPAYANVILHVVQVIGALTLDALGCPVPTVALDLTAATPLPLPLHPPCVHQQAPLLERVEAAGIERFHDKAARFEGDLQVVSPDQVLWRGIAEALGYARNTATMARLADALPYAEVAPLARQHGADATAALLLDTAGLLDSASPAEHAAWQHLQPHARAWLQLPSTAWDQDGVRPGNAPARRLRGLAHLVTRWSGGARESATLADLLLESVRQAAANQRPTPWRLFTAAPWIGAGRARTIVVNVLLPFAHAAGLPEAEHLYRRLPGEPFSRPIAYMAAQFQRSADARQSFRTACQRQGLLHLFKTQCAARRCDTCPARAHPHPAGAPV